MGQVDRVTFQYQDHIQLSGQMPFPMDEGAANFPEDIQEAIPFIAHRNTQEILGFRGETIAKLTNQANRLPPDLIRIRSTLPYEGETTKVRLHLPSLSSFLHEHGMGGSDWLEQFIRGFLMLGEVGEPGVYDGCSPKFRPLSRDELFETAKDRWAPEKTPNEPRRPTLWSEALSQTEKGWLAGPRPYTTEGKLQIGGENVTVNPAYRFGVQQAEKLRAVGDLKRSSTDEATSVLTPINLPSWGLLVNMCIFF